MKLPLHNLVKGENAKTRNYENASLQSGQKQKRKNAQHQKRLYAILSKAKPRKGKNAQMPFNSSSIPKTP